MPNGPGVAVLNYNTWQRRFGGDPKVIGTTMLLDGRPLEIVGVMPSGLDLPRGAEFWAPSVPIIVTGNPPNTGTLNTFGVFYVVGRLRPGLDAARARADLDALEARLDQATPGRPKWGARAVVTPFVDYVFGPVRPALWALWAAVATLLVIACANVAALMLTRASVRQREQAVRLALGASRAAIGRLWMLEIAIIAAAGGAFGLVIANGLAAGIVALAPDDLPRIGDVSINLPVALFTFGMVLAAALLTGAIPLAARRGRESGAGARWLAGDRRPPRARRAVCPGRHPDRPCGRAAGRHGPGGSQLHRAAPDRSGLRARPRPDRDRPPAFDPGPTEPVDERPARAAPGPCRVSSRRVPSTSAR